MMLSDDTSRAMKAIMPMADALGIKVYFPADRTIMVCNGQRIAIGENSTWATIMEFVGYVFLTRYVKGFPSRFGFSKKLEAAISAAVKRYLRDK